MEQKPEVFGIQYAETFKDHQVVAAYRFRPPYPPEIFTILAGLLNGEPRTVLDVGAGSGDLARQLVTFAERVDAVDFSQHMIARGRQLPRGNHPRLHWIYGKIEEVPLSPPYALITAGSSIHWPNWSLAFPRFRSMLTPGGYLALVYRRTLPMPWHSELRQIQAQFTTHTGSRSRHVVTELQERHYFQQIGEQETTPIPFVQSIDDFIEGLHSRSSYSRELMGEEKAREFDRQVRKLLLQHHDDGILPMQVVGTVTWGKPETGA